MSGVQNPAAFPSTWRVLDKSMVRVNGGEPATAKGNQEFIESGMTLRDYFAAAMLPVVPDMFSHNMKDNERHPDYMARRAYEYADAMLKAREP